VHLSTVVNIAVGTDTIALPHGDDRPFNVTTDNVSDSIAEAIVLRTQPAGELHLFRQTSHPQ
jgi:hypothetical protein